MAKEYTKHFHSKVPSKFTQIGFEYISSGNPGSTGKSTSTHICISAKSATEAVLFIRFEIENTDGPFYSLQI
jgi:hypothetical protein